MGVPHANTRLASVHGSDGVTEQLQYWSCPSAVIYASEHGVTAGELARSSRL